MTTERASPSPRQTDIPSPGDARGELRAGLRGTTFDEGAARLAPTQDSGREAAEAGAGSERTRPAPGPGWTLYQHFGLASIRMRHAASQVATSRHPGRDASVWLDAAPRAINELSAAVRLFRRLRAQHQLPYPNTGERRLLDHSIRMALAEYASLTYAIRDNLPALPMPPLSTVHAYVAAIGLHQHGDAGDATLGSLQLVHPTAIQNVLDLGTKWQEQRQASA